MVESPVKKGSSFDPGRPELRVGACLASIPISRSPHGVLLRAPTGRNHGRHGRLPSSLSLSSNGRVCCDVNSCFMNSCLSRSALRAWEVRRRYCRTAGDSTDYDTEQAAGAARGRTVRLVRTKAH